MVTSIVLDFENSKNRGETSSGKIQMFMDTWKSEYIDEKTFANLIPLREEIKAEGIKTADASHLACAIHAGCDYFITTDDRLFNYKGGRIKVISPVDFITIEEE